MWAFVTLVSLILLFAILARENDISLSSIFSSNEDSSDDIVENSSNNSSENTGGSYNTSNNPDPISQDCLDHDGLARHDHATLQIFINGQQEVIPANVGIMTDICNKDGEEMHAVHTHDSSGRLHIESNEDIDIPIGVFFDIWGHHFDETGIFEYRVNSTHELIMTVGGQEIDQYDDYLLINTSDIIEIRYQEK
ncbi:MAG: hypothetical protein DWB99_08280 [Candidatus Poseidoniales archaeon]|nr:MAG: hypothetical protein DWB99_08280 [Candidatus Poseidoniales archaeon]|tara:strand:+ start:592 stop:1173 length:582 start_codon:yes stop_codon:yes gene_type:complete